MKNVYVHPNGICESANIGEGTRIWAFSHILPGARIGKNCNICDHVFIENQVVIGDSVTIKCGVQIWDGLRICDNVFIGPNATFTNDNFPRSKEHLSQYPETVIERGASIGAGAVILPGIKIGTKAMVGAGAVITRDVPPNAIVFGNPATITGYVNVRQEGGINTYIASEINNIIKPINLGVGNCQLWSIPHFDDLRGSLLPIEFEGNLPFAPSRHFIVYGVPNNRVRGEHAHKKCEQFLCAISGNLRLVADDGNNACEVYLDSPAIGLYIPAKVWSIQYKFSNDAILSVYASEPYDSGDYIRSYEDYLKYIKDN